MAELPVEAPQPAIQTKTWQSVFEDIANASRRTRFKWAVNRLLGRVQRSPRTARNAVVFAWQRLTRGWDDRSVWSLDFHLTKQLGAQLTFMAQIAHGHPVRYVGGFDAWVADLRTHGTALSKYAAEEDTADLDAAQEVHDAAQLALRWVAENLGALWD